MNNNIDIEKTGKFILQLRKEMGYTQNQLADLVGVSCKSISKWETGNGFPDVIYHESLCSALEITVYELINGEKDIKLRHEFDKFLIINKICTVIAVFVVLFCMWQTFII